MRNGSETVLLDIDEVNRILNDLYEEIPEPLFQRLNGGVLLLEEEKRRSEENGDLYTMGEYCHDGMGRYIKIYYGSFAALLSRKPRKIWEEELRKTLRHELTHHVEGLAGERTLEEKDQQQLEAFRSGLL